MMNENSIEVVRKLSLVGHSGEVLFYRGLRDLINLDLQIGPIT